MKLLWKEFMKYVVPSVIGMMVSALYVVVDGIFVGRGIGASALVSINIVNVTYHQSTENSTIANIISTSRGMVFPIIFLIVLPLIIGDIGIWISIILGEICTLLLIMYLVHVKKVEVKLKEFKLVRSK